MHKIFLLAILVTLFTACNQERQTNRVIYDETKSDTLTMNNVLEDTTKVLVAGMPVCLDSTDVLIHPIGWVSIYKEAYGNKLIDGSVSIDYPRIGKSKMAESNYSFEVQSNNKDYLYGEMVNLIFEDVPTGTQRILTDKVMIIISAKYLKDVAKKIDKHYMLYSARDKDYNRDGKLDYEDMTAYYMSNLDGTNFTKITQDYHYFDTSELLLKNSKYYFRTLEDVNKDGIFNKKDKYHYYYIDLKKGDFTPIEYFPLELMNVE